MSEPTRLLTMSLAQFNRCRSDFTFLSPFKIFIIADAVHAYDPADAAGALAYWVGLPDYSNTVTIDANTKRIVYTTDSGYIAGGTAGYAAGYAVGYPAGVAAGIITGTAAGLATGTAQGRLVRYLAVSRDSYGSWSLDGISWHLCTTLPKSGIVQPRAMAYGNGMYHVFYNDCKASRSANGIDNWAGVYSVNGGGGDYSIETAAYLNGNFLIGGRFTQGCMSPDGAAWTPFTFGVALGYISCFGFQGGLYIAGGYGAVLFTDIILKTSPDGAVWTDQAPPANLGYPTSFATDGTTTVMVGHSDVDAGYIATSPDGIAWTPRVSGAADGLEGVCWSGTQFVAVGKNGGVYTSPTGVVWTARVSGTASYLVRVSYDSFAAKFVAYGDGNVANVVIYSTDGITWTVGTNGIGNAIQWGGSMT